MPLLPVAGIWAATAASPPLIVIAAGSTGLAVFALVRALAVLAWSAPRAESAGFEQARRERLRRGDVVFRWFEGAIDRLAAHHSANSPDRLEAIRAGLVAGAVPLPWLPGEYLATVQLTGALIGVGALGLGAVFALALALDGGDPIQAAATGLGAGGVFGGFLGVIYPTLALGQVASLAKKRVSRLVLRLPYAIDLMALMMEAGASFQESLVVVVRESRGTPLGEELGEVLRQVDLGKPRRAALEGFQNRVKVDDVSEIVFAINKGEELGTPLGQILKNQAVQLRLKRSQWLEKAAGEAQVKIVFPGMLVMVASLLVIVTPFILNVLNAPRE